MQINNLGGVRGPVTTTTSSTSQTARTSFSTLMQGGASAPAAGRAGIPGASVISSAVSAAGGSTPGANLGAPYQQAMPASEQQEALKDLMKMSLMSFASTTFAMGQSRPKIEALED